MPTSMQTEQFGRRMLGWTRRAVIIFTRIAIGAGFLSSVADRFGVWGAPGSTNVAWGDFSHYLAYLARIAPFVPAHAVRTMGWVVTVAEAVLGTALIGGVQTRLVAALSGCLLLFFAVGMTTGTGIKTTLDASIFTAAAAAFLLALYPGSN
ncbi:MAG TPA: hypothetical protein VND92_11915 [Vicinamibacterales bacterium]|nr:hypothetical protein [Vicinamibacterales bacterium]